MAIIRKVGLKDKAIVTQDIDANVISINVNLKERSSS